MFKYNKYIHCRRIFKILQLCKMSMRKLIDFTDNIGLVHKITQTFNQEV